MRYFLFLILLFTCAELSAQVSQWQIIRLYDRNTGKPVSDVKLTFSGRICISDDLGVGRIQKVFADTLYLSHLSYRDTALHLSLESFEKMNISLQPKNVELREVEINIKPLEIFAPENAHVFDFLFIGDTLLALTYEREIMLRSSGLQGEELYSGCHIVVMLPSGKILVKRKLANLITGFFRSGFGQNYLLGVENTWFVDVQHGDLILKPVLKSIFDENVNVPKDVTSAGLIIDNYDCTYPEFSYFYNQLHTNHFDLIRTVCDDFTMQLFRAEFKYMSGYDKLRAMRLQTATGIDKEVIAAYMTGFSHSTYYQPLYAPIFCSSDTLYIFDHPNKYIFRHSPKGLALDSVPIRYLNATGVLKFSDSILMDRSTASFYACFRSNGRNYLRKIDLATGSSGPLLKMYHPYPEKICIRNNVAYYLYRAVAGSKTKHLFAERL